MSIYSELYSWQKEIVDAVMDKSAFGLFLDCGLGKTPISLALAEQHHCTKIIVITINAKALESDKVSGSWFNWSNKSNMNYKQCKKSASEFDSESSDIFVINYESLYSRSKNKTQKVELKKNVVEFIKSCKNKNVCIIVDESHKMKDIHSMQTQAINKIKNTLRVWADNVYAYLLTGTPFTTGYIDLYSQLNFLGYPENKTYFIDSYCVRGNIPGLLGWQQPIIGYKNVESLFDLIHKYAITIESSAVANLPEQIFITHNIPQTEDFTLFTTERVSGKQILNYINKKSYTLSELNEDELSTKLKVYDTNTKVNNPFYRDIGFNISKRFSQSPWFAETTGAFWLRARQLSIGFNGNAEEYEWYENGRLNALEKFLKENEDNYLLFYNFTPELLEIYPICEKLGYNIDIYCGEIKNLQFYEKYANQTNSEKLTNKKNIILANFASGSTGLNWQEYNKCIIFSLPVYKDWSQGIKRLHRTGQKSNVIYHIFRQNNWLDNGMYKALQEQVDYSQKMFESDLKRVESLNISK